MSGVKQFLSYVYENYMYKISIKLRLRILIYLILVSVSGLGFYTYSEIDNSLQELVNLQETVGAEAAVNVENVHQHLSSTQSHLAKVTFFVLLVGALYAFFILRSIISPLASVRERVLGIVAEADLSLRINHNSKDELGAMMRAMDTMLEKFQGITREVKNTTGKVMGSMGDMSTIADETNSAVVEQQERITEIASLIDQLSMTVEDVINKNQQVVEAAEQADTEAHSGQQMVQESIANIESLAGEVERAYGVIQSLDERGKSIGAVIDLIRDVAEQTNLLALNAAIEAARAGEQGRGFAVVADEVRNLASRTQDATQEIQKTIEEIQQETKEATEVMGAGRKKAEQGVEQVLNAGKFLKAIAQDVSTIKEMLVGIKMATEAQNMVAGEVRNNINGIREISDRTADYANQTSSASHELTQLSKQLDGQVSQFKI